VTRAINRVGVFGCYCFVELGDELLALVAVNGIASVNAADVGEHPLVLLDDRVMVQGVLNKRPRAKLMPPMTRCFS